MKILITNHWFKRYGGSETFTYTLFKELQRRGHEVWLYTKLEGALSQRMVQEGVKMLYTNDQDFDLILANHNSCVFDVYGMGPIIQTCHGTIPKLEQPHALADAYVSISEEVQWNLLEKYGYESTLIRNGIDCNRFKPMKPLNKKLTKVLSLAHSDEANAIIQKACDQLDVDLYTIDKYKDGVFDIENHINEVDLVVSLGRGAYEAMACGRPVVVFDARKYMEAYGDGYLSEKWIDEVIKCNCSGRLYKQVNDAISLEVNMKYYNPKDGKFLRAYALEHFNIEKQVDKYLEVANSI